MRTIRSKLRVALAESLCGRILDCGSGEDLFGPYLRRAANKVVSLDLDEKALRQTPGLRVAESCTRLPFPNDCFDAVWSCAIIEHVAEDCLPEMIRVTRPGGRVVAIMPNRCSPFDQMKRVLGLYTWETTPEHVRLYDLEELESYGPVRGELVWVPLFGWLFWRYPLLAHVWILGARVTEALKEKVRRSAGPGASQTGRAVGQTGRMPAS